MRMRILTLGLGIALLGIVSVIAGPATAQAPAAGPIQPWGLPPLPPGVGPVEKFADISSTPQSKFLEGGAFDNRAICGLSGSPADRFPTWRPPAIWCRE